jgi:hypothetical protein
VSDYVPEQGESCAKDPFRFAGISSNRSSPAVVTRGRRGGGEAPKGAPASAGATSSGGRNPLRRALVVEASSVRLNIDQLRAKWQHVAICEVDGNWSMTGPSYSGIGFLNSTWHQYGGAQFAPLAGEASRDQQIVIGMKVTHGRIPDQDGCSPDGW